MNRFTLYLKYLVTGERAVNMDSNLIALCDTIRIVVLLFVGALAQGFSNNFARGDYSISWANVTTFIMPVVIVILNYAWKFARDITNPVVPVGAVLGVVPPHAQITQQQGVVLPDLSHVEQPDPTIPKE